MNDIESSGYLELLADIKQRIRSAQYEALKVSQLQISGIWLNFIQNIMTKKFGLKNQAKLAVKDHYTFDFLELADEHSEHQLEEALIINIRNFLCELGFCFAFLGNQFRFHGDRISQRI